MFSGMTQCTFIYEAIDQTETKIMVGLLYVLEVCKSDPKPIGFRNKYYISDWI